MSTEWGRRYAQVIKENPGRTEVERKRRRDAYADYKEAVARHAKEKATA